MPQMTTFEALGLSQANGLIDLSSDTLAVALSNTAPDDAADDQFADITEIAAGNGYTAGGFDMANVSIAESERADDDQR